MITYGILAAMTLMLAPMWSAPTAAPIRGYEKWNCLWVDGGRAEWRACPKADNGLEVVLVDTQGRVWLYCPLDITVTRKGS